MAQAAIVKLLKPGKVAPSDEAGLSIAPTSKDKHPFKVIVKNRLADIQELFDKAFKKDYKLKKLDNKRKVLVPKKKQDQSEENQALVEYQGNTPVRLEASLEVTAYFLDIVDELPGDLAPIEPEEPVEEEEEEEEEEELMAKVFLGTVFDPHIPGGHSFIGISEKGDFKNAKWYEVWTEERRGQIVGAKFYRRSSLRIGLLITEKYAEILQKEININQYLKAFEKAESMVGKIDYRDITNNCTVHCSKVLNEAGITIPMDFFGDCHAAFNPSELYEYVQEKHGFIRWP